MDDLVEKKSDALEKFKRFVVIVEQESKEKIQTFRTDRGGDFTSLDFNTFCESNGNHQETSYSSLYPAAKRSG